MTQRSPAAPPPAYSFTHGAVAALLWCLAAVAALVPITLLGVYASSVTERSMRHLVQSDNRAAAQLAAHNVQIHLSSGLMLAASVGEGPRFSQAVRQRDPDFVRERLKILLHSDPSIDRAYVLDTHGVLWSDYPMAPESLNQDFSQRDYFRGVSQSWTPYVSEVFQRQAAPRPLVVGLATPIRDEHGQPIAVLVLQHRLETITGWLREITIGSGGHVIFLDQRGIVAGHPRLDPEGTPMTMYADLPPVQQALHGIAQTLEYTDPLTARPMVAAFVPVALGPGQNWVVIAQQDRAAAYAPVTQLRRQILVAATLIAVLTLAASLTLARVTQHNQLMRRQLAIQNSALQQAVAAEQQAHAALKQAQAHLLQTEKLASLGQMVAGVAHEINNPLSFVANNLAVLQRDVAALKELLLLYQSADPRLVAEDPALAARIAALTGRIDLPCTLGNLDELTARSREGLKRIEQIVKDLRSFARLDDADLHEADLNAGITSSVNIARGLARKRRIDFELQLADLPLVRCFPARINQVVLNLLANAIDASPENSAITIQTHRLGERVRIDVIDRGCGIPPGVLPRIFDPFFTTKPQGQGMGLGLAITYGIVQQHGCTIEVDSTPGKGTRMSVFLPIRPPHATANVPATS